MEKEEVLFENSFLMTQERYLALCNHPKGKKAVRQLRLWQSLMIAGMLGALLLTVMEIAQREMSFAVLGILLFLLFAYRLFFQRGIRNKKRYTQIREAQASDEWRRVVRFSQSGIEIEDANSITKIGYHEITRLTQDGECVLLWRGENYVLRLRRDEFTCGSDDAFAAFIHRKMSENQTAEKRSRSEGAF